MQHFCYFALLFLDTAAAMAALARSPARYSSQGVLSPVFTAPLEEPPLSVFELLPEPFEPLPPELFPEPLELFPLEPLPEPLELFPLEPLLPLLALELFPLFALFPLLELPPF